MLKEFKEFIMRGNVLDLAVGVIIGGAFTSIVNALVNGIITPLIGLIIKLLTNHKDMKEATSGMVFNVNGIKFEYGTVISAIITFLITAFVLFLIVKAVNKAEAIIPSKEKEQEEEEAPKETTDSILADIRELLEKQEVDSRGNHSKPKDDNQ
ncbi:large conductance mechanosensitive channel protein MscL [Vagococcus vulneris]|uniref:Large-conductance mechanosensitive channel n=1 Tax=Vagococcus vulneris TaxID=1977869 RepID=A0A429ZVF5_9ENTE|nr:large conductance mechanosensitive channel protein MscL [Vagococcus vulneris]RST97609.1 mechanosensitive ion channel protein MscL [Vagococcus vulneris]